MKKLVILDKKRHRKYQVLKADISHSHDLHICTVSLAEFNPLARACPIIFTASKETGRLESCALLGVKPGQNLFWQNGEWQGDYIPSAIRNHPFYLRYKPGDFTSAYVCVDTSQLLLGEGRAEGVDLFDDKGEPSQYLLETQHRLKVMHARRLQDWEFVSCLQKLGLLQEKVILVDLPGNTKHKLKGAFCISEERLGKLAQAEFLSLRNKGYLPYIYAHLFSLQQSSKLSALHKSNQTQILH
ncbi:SapC family protein [Microbulbifer sp. OS29]|uniref:SapC family protein n=1 Tax=Microbulbifer okhotskensis TaxID=2926617 RepID=A0A9X2EJT5_9GAMM|nr:SapC family protein [Microbulbifer okhotskensis]MCO1332935.1 SapC family protein [Microbulbifer okhotskensis]